MAAPTPTAGPSLPVLLTTRTPYALPAQRYMLPASWRRFQLSALVNKALALPKPVPFDFLVRGSLLRGSLAEWCKENDAGMEETLEIEYVESVLPPRRAGHWPSEEWMSAVSCAVPG